MKKFLVVSEENLRARKIIKLNKDELVEFYNKYDVYFTNEMQSSIKPYYLFEETQDIFSGDTEFFETSLEEIFL